MMTRNTRNEPPPQMSSLPSGAIGFGAVALVSVVAPVSALKRPEAEMRT